MANYNLFDAASLAMIPTGVKEDKVYSIKPTDGSGDLAFSRSNDTATRVNSSGLIEKVRTNLLTYSEDFTQNWSLIGGGSVTANTTTAPDGTLTADTWTQGSYVRRDFTFSAIPYTYTLYVKATSGTSTGRIYFLNSADTAVAQTYYTANATGWQRISVTIQNPVASGIVRIGFGIDSGTTSLYVWGAQLETGDIATDYIATTSAAVSVGPVANLPRLDYSGGASCPKLLLEPQRTNTMLQSENLNTSWTPIRAIATSNAATSPDGYANADKLIADTDTNTTHLFFQNKTSQAAGTYAYSAFFKKSEYEFGAVRIATDSDTKRFAAVVNLNTGAITATDSFGSPTGTSSKVEDYGNGWYRLIVTCAHTSGDILGVTTLSPTAVPTFSNSLPAFTGDNTSGVFTWGAQLEAGAYATSYIPTLSAASTRGADAASKTGISSLIGQTEGTIFVDFVFNGNPTSVDYSIMILGAIGSNYITIGGYNTYLYSRIYNGSSQGAINALGMVAGTRYKAAVAYAENDVVMYVNGVNEGSDTSVSIPALSQIGFTRPSYEHSADVKQSLVFPTRLTNAELAALTTI